MQHLGDITQVHGYDIEPVDVITFGSPCQDLSTAGKRAGLKGKKSGLFLEAIRIIKEMREATDGEYPTFALWENVSGAFSSKKGEDFRAVLTEFASVCGNTDLIPRPNKKWIKAGCVMGDNWSIAWRVLDAQCWGVPQRRKRVFAVADFGGARAPQILFKPESLSRDFIAGEKAWKVVTTCADRGAGSTNGICCIDGNIIGRQPKNGGNGIGYQYDVSYTLTATDRHAVAYTGHKTHVLTYDCRGNGNGKIVNTLTGDHQNRVTDYTAIIVNRRVRRLTPTECERLQGYPDNWTKIKKIEDMTAEEYEFWSDVWMTARSIKTGKPKETLKPPEKSSLVKWYNKLDIDSARYTACGNSIAVICAVRVLGGIADYLPQGATLGSLFDGIGSFPLAWQLVQGEDTTRWASEVEPLPIAVTKQNFKK